MTRSREDIAKEAIALGKRCSVDITKDCVYAKRHPKDCPRAKEYRKVNM
jgi:hypothetical protein